MIYYTIDKVITLLYFITMNYTTITIKETRSLLSELIERVALSKETFLVTKFGKPKALIISPDQIAVNQKDKADILRQTAGLWQNKKEIKNSSAWLAKIRKKTNSRYEKILG